MGYPFPSVHVRLSLVFFLSLSPNNYDDSNHYYYSFRNYIYWLVYLLLNCAIDTVNYTLIYRRYNYFMQLHNFFEKNYIDTIYNDISVIIFLYSILENGKEQRGHGSSGTCNFHRSYQSKYPKVDHRRTLPSVWRDHQYRDAIRPFLPEVQGLRFCLLRKGVQYGCCYCR